MSRVLISLICSALLVVASSSFAKTVPKVALIIDDMGYRDTDFHAFELPSHVAFAILPHTQHSKRFSAMADQQGRVVMLHLPMETLHPQNLGPGALLASMNANYLIDTFEDALASVPHAVGLNNHMGSKLTQLSFPMTTLMQAVAKHDLFFVDSRTTRYSKAFTIATEFGIPSVQRKVFLDHDLSEEAIEQQFDRLVRLSRKYGEALGIGHPHPQTLAVLQRRLAAQNDVIFVAVTELLNPQESPRIVRRDKRKDIGTERLSVDAESSVELSP